MISRDKLIIMLELQTKLNAKINPDWIAAKYPWHRAIMVEGVEALEHLGWKWWKKQDPDFAQARIELVDIWHFLLSWALTDAQGDVATATSWMHINFQTLAYDMGNVETRQVLDLLIGASGGRRVHGSAFVRLMDDFDLSWNQLYDIYVAKNVLNVFRQDHGYKAGTYIKDWRGAEDNVRLEQIMMLHPKATPDQLYGLLEQGYSDVLNALKEVGVAA